MITAQAGKFTTLVSAQNVTHGATVTANLDMRGAKHVTILVNKGANTVATSNALTVSFLHSDDTNATTFATVTANVTHGSSAALHVISADWKSKKRYGRVAITPGTAAGDATIVAAEAFVTRQEEGPKTNADLATSAVIVG